MRSRYRIKKARWGIAVAGAVVAMVILAAIGASYQILVEWREANRFPAPGALVEVGGRKLHVICTGAPRSSIFPGSSRDPVSQWPTSQDMSSAGNGRTWL
jgi:hypothetical protein